MKPPSEMPRERAGLLNGEGGGDFRAGAQRIKQAGDSEWEECVWGGLVAQDSAASVQNNCCKQKFDFKQKIYINRPVFVMSSFQQ